MDIPKLPNQDQFLLDLQNNNYSTQTILSYARDLCIFSVYIYFRDVEFKNISKEDISMYKGYLRNGNHLKDLDKVRKKVLDKGVSEVEAPRGSRTNDTESKGMNTPRYEVSFLDNVYRKVYGSLGILERPLNARARSKGGLDFRSINRMLSALRSYLKYLIENDIDIPIPPDAVKMAKAEKKVKKVASKEDLIRLIESPMEFEKDKKVALRNRCMLEMLFATGMRISELIGLDIDQINMDGKMYIFGKGKKERAIFLTPRSMNWLNRYLKLRLEHAFSDREKKEQPGNVDRLFTDLGIKHETSKDDSQNDDEDLTLDVFDSENRKYIKLVEEYRRNSFLERFDSPALFVPFSGSRFGKDNTRLSTNYFQERIVVYRKKLGIQIPTSAHSLRHGFATYLAEEGASATALQVLLGHESLNTTTKYIHASEKFAEETVRKNHPLRD